jgi:hypothetical protein
MEMMGMKIRIQQVLQYLMMHEDQLSVKYRQQQRHQIQLDD